MVSQMGSVAEAGADVTCDGSGLCQHNQDGVTEQQRMRISQICQSPMEWEQLCSKHCRLCSRTVSDGNRSWQRSLLISVTILCRPQLLKEMYHLQHVELIRTARTIPRLMGWSNVVIRSSRQCSRTQCPMMKRMGIAQVRSGHVSPGEPLARGYFVATSKEKKIYKVKLKIKVKLIIYLAEVSLMAVQLKLNKE